jgi:hypothetical protein
LGFNKRVGDDELEDMIGLAFDMVRRFPLAVVESAIEGLIADPPQYFPKPGEIRKRCFERERATAPKTQEATQNDRCTSCDRRFFVAGYECATGVIVGRLRCDCPQGGSGWDTEKAKAFWEGDSLTPTEPQMVYSKMSQRFQGIQEGDAYEEVA